MPVPLMYDRFAVLPLSVPGLILKTQAPGKTTGMNDCFYHIALKPTTVLCAGPQSVLNEL